jgi:hypothetical protein
VPKICSAFTLLQLSGDLGDLTDRTKLDFTIQALAALVEIATEMNEAVFLAMLPNKALQPQR